MTGADRRVKSSISAYERHSDTRVAGPIGCDLDRWRPSASRSNLVVAAGVTISALLFLATFAIFAARGQPYDSDTAHVISHRDRDFGEFIPWFGINTRLIVFSVVRLFDIEFSNIMPLLLIAGLVAWAGFVHTLWLTWRYRLLTGVGLVTAAVFIGSNHPVHEYGGWALISYSVALYSSTLLLHCLFRGDPAASILSWRSCLTTAFYLVAIGMLYTRAMMPGAMLGATIALANCRSNGISLKQLVQSAARAVVMIAPTLCVGLVKIALFTPPDLNNPRAGIRHLYFHATDHGYQIGAAVNYVADGLYNYCLMAFAPSELALSMRERSIIALAATTFFCWGFVVSFLRFPSRRFNLAVYLAITLLAWAVLGLLGWYPFGDPRYALFIHLPVLVMAAIGFDHILRGMKKVTEGLVARFSERRVPDGLYRAMACGIGIALLLGQCDMTYEIALAARKHHADWLEGMHRVKSAPAGVPVVFDRMIWYEHPYFRSVGLTDSSRRGYRINVVGAESRSKDFRSFLGRYKHFFTVTAGSLDAPIYGGVGALVRRRGFREVLRVRLSRWHSLQPWYFSEWFAPRYNYLRSPNDLLSEGWLKQGGVQAFKTEEVHEGIEKTSASSIVLEPGGQISQWDDVPVEAGETISSGLVMWSEAPAEMVMVLEAWSEASYEGGYRRISLSEKPEVYGKSYQFLDAHDSASLRLLNLGSSSVQLSARDGYLHRSPESFLPADHPRLGWTGEGKTSVVELLENGDERKPPGIRCLTGARPWDGVRYQPVNLSDFENPFVAVRPGTRYRLSVEIRGLSDYEGVEVHVLVYDQAARRLAMSKVPLTAEFTVKSLVFRTGDAPGPLTVGIFKRKSERRLEFAVRNLELTQQ